MSYIQQKAISPATFHNRDVSPYLDPDARRVTLFTESDALAQRVCSMMQTVNVEVLHTEDLALVPLVATTENASLILIHWEVLTFTAIGCCTSLKADPILAKVPLVVLSDWTTEAAEKTALDAGANAYEVTNSADRDIIRRIADRLDQQSITASGRFLFYADLALDLPGWRLHCAGSSAKLTIAEYDLLCTMMRHPDQPLSRKRLVDGMSTSRPRRREDRVNVHVRQLRRVLNDIGSRTTITAADGIGYSLTSP